MTRRLALTIAIVAAVGALSGFGTYSAFSSTTGNSGNSMQAGTVSITDNHTASAMLNLTNAKPSDRTTGCLKVTYNGSLPATVRMYATPSGTLAPYLKVTITRGTGGGYPACTGFTADASAATTFSGTLNALPASWSAAGDDPAGSGTTEQWTQGETHSYQVDVQLDPSAPAAAQGQSAAVSFTWEARNQ
jgi:hypothetical protein